MVGSVKSSLLCSELSVTFDILFIEVSDEIFHGVFSDGALMPIMTSLHIQSSIVEDLQHSVKHSTFRNGFMHWLQVSEFLRCDARGLRFCHQR